MPRKAAPSGPTAMAGRAGGVWARARPMGTYGPPLVLVAVILLVGAMVLGTRLATPSDGTVVLLSDRLPDTTLPVSAVLDPASGLRPGDVVVGLDGVDVAGAGGRDDRRIGDVVLFDVLRDGAPVRVAVVLGPWRLMTWVEQNWPAVVLGLCLLGICGYVFVRRPTDPAARTLLVIGPLEAVGVLSYVLGGQVVDLVDGRGLLWLWCGELCLAALWAAWLSLMMQFPEPLEGVRARRLTALCVVVLAVTYGAYLLVAVPTAGSPAVAAWRIVSVSLLPGYLLPPLIVVGVAAQWWRMRRRGERVYLTWLLASFALCGVLFCSVWQLPMMVRGAPLVSWEYVPFIGLPCVVTLAAAVLRFGLFDVKAVAGRSLVYGLLTVVVAAGYAAIVVVVGALLTTGPVPLLSLVPSLLATVVLALLVQPVKDQLQRGVSRLFYGNRDEPYQALARLGHQLESAAAAGTALPRVVDTVAAALRLPYVAVELCAIDGAVLRRAERGVDGQQAPPITLPATIGGQLVGRLQVAPRRPASAFTDAELRLLTDLTRQASPALRALQLSVDLQQSRERLLRARAEERRRLQRDLHDGIGPSLAGLVMQAGAARVLLGSGEVSRASGTLVEIERQLVECGSDLRSLLVGLRSPLLDSLGLVGALRYQAQRFGADTSLDITVEVPAEMPSLPAAVEEATLAVASEALTNVVRHARARRCAVRVAVEGQVELRVTDDGQGLGAGPSTGIGLHSMKQRAAELGGEVRVRPLSGGGTEVLAALPLASP